MRARRIRHLGISPAERVVTRKKLGGKWDLRAILVAQTTLPPFFAFLHTSHLIGRFQLEFWNIFTDIFSDIFYILWYFIGYFFTNFSLKKLLLSFLHSYTWLIWSKDTSASIKNSPIFPPDVFTLQSCVRKIWNTILSFSFFNHALFKYLQSQDLLHWFRPYLILADNFRNFPTYSTQTFFEQILVEANSFSRKYPWK